MAVTVGRVAYLKMSSSYTIVNVLLEQPTGLGIPPIPPGPSNEILLIFFGSQSEGPINRFTDELSRAMARGLRVRLRHGNDSAYINEVLVEAPLEGSLV